MSTVTSKPIKADELLAMGDIGRCELIYGELVMMSPAGAEHGMVAGRIFRMVSQFVDDHNLGVTFAAETGFKLDEEPDLVRAPDVSFVRRNRLGALVPKGYFPGAPDLAVEVLSPGDSRRNIGEKTSAWLAHGSISVWVADPSKMTIDIVRAGESRVSFASHQSLVDERLFPGFSMPLTRVFQLPLAPRSQRTHSNGICVI